MGMATTRPATTSKPPIERIPPELLSRVFIFCLHPSSNTPWVQAAPLLIRICRLWRNVANSTAQLWTNIHILIDEQHLSLDPSGLSAWLERSVPKPLDVSIIDEGGLWGPRDLDIAIDVLAPHLARWRSFRCKCRKLSIQRIFDVAAGGGGFPLLEELDTDSMPAASSPSLALCRCPRLSTVTTQEDLIFRTSRDDPPYALQTVGGYLRSRLSTCYDLINNSPSLRSLTVDCFGVPPPFIGPTSPITRHALTHLNLSLFFLNEQSNRFLDSITLPSLQTLKIVVDEASHIQHLCQ